MPSSKLPKYEIIKQDLLKEIQTHKFLPGEKFYSEAEIKRKYNVSSITSVKALNELSAEGYLNRIQGKGTFVSKSKISATVDFHDIENHDLSTETLKVISMTKEHSTDILEKLKLNDSQNYYKILRIRSFNKKPFIVHIIYIPETIISHPNDPKYYSKIHKKSGLDSSIDLKSPKSIQTYEVIFPTPTKVAELLNMPENEPSVKQVRISYLSDNKVAEYQISYKNWKYFKTELSTSTMKSQ